MSDAYLEIVNQFDHIERFSLMQTDGNVERLLSDPTTVISAKPLCFFGNTI
jgi:hypothetical protein